MSRFVVFDETHELVETDEVIDVHRVCRTAWGARRAVKKMNSIRTNMGGFYMIRYEVRKRGRLYEVVVLQNIIRNKTDAAS